jgi:putative SOS response-associated peptidase YedK
MCFHSQQSKSAQELKHRFKAKFEDEEEYRPEVYNGFRFPKTPVITRSDVGNIQLFNWGLIPHWAKDDSIRKSTLNARIETIHEKPSFRNVVHNRCLVLADGFYEWKWLDDAGKKKQKYLITMPDNDAFAFAGLYSHWTDRNTGEIISTYTILTTEAIGLMREIHNSKKRMPVILDRANEQLWLSGQTDTFHEIELIAIEV